MARVHDVSVGQRGLTLMEILAAMIIIIGLMAISLPVIRGGMSHSEFRDALNTFSTQVEFARIQAASRNRAYLVMVAPATEGTRGSISVTEGISASCTPDNFVDDDSPPDAIENLRVVDFALRHPRVRIKSQSPDTLGDTGLCIKPDGRVLEASSAGGVVITPPTGYASGEAVFELELLSISGASTGLIRRVVVPYNGVPKLE
jgi:type II secretory pathway pseudopilin PulG